jgi:hypothetical protein
MEQFRDVRLVEFSAGHATGLELPVQLEAAMGDFLRSAVPITATTAAV